MATIKQDKANSFKTNKAGLIFANHDVPFTKPEMLEICSEACWFFRCQTYQAMATGSNKNNQKNSGFTNSFAPNILIRLLVI
jgi:hypothetical protein